MGNTNQIQEVLFKYVKDNTYKDISNLDAKSMLFSGGYPGFNGIRTFAGFPGGVL